jgi:hypothetical protein
MTRIRLQTLLGAHVSDVNGQQVGTVHDARFTADGPPLPSGRPAYRLSALTCGPVTLGMRLGYGRGVHGPWPLDRLFRLLARHSRLVDWEQVVSFDGGHIRLNVERDQLTRLLAAHQDASGEDTAGRRRKGEAR